MNKQSYICQKAYHAQWLKYAFCVLAALWLTTIPTIAQDDEDSLATDIKVTLLAVAPGYTAYTAHGHCALRMQCPSAGLDISFTYGLDDNVHNRMAFFAGSGMGEYSAVYTSDYLQGYADEGRRVEEYELNLSLNEKRQLWALLDNELTNGASRRYNYLHTNCSSMCAYAVGRALDGDRLDYQQLPPALLGTYRDFVRHISRNRPWVSFFWLSLLSAEGEKRGQLEDKLSPQLLVEAWQQAMLVDTMGSRRPMIIGEGKVLVNGDDGSRTIWFTPTLFFTLLLVLVLLISVAEWKGCCRRLVFGTDIFLLAAQTVLGLLLCYMSFVSELVGASGNWLVLIFNPLPFLLWLFCRHRRWYYRSYLFYVVVLAFFVCMAPLNPQIDFSHSLLAFVLGVRCLARYLQYRK